MPFCFTGGFLCSAEILFPVVPLVYFCFGARFFKKYQRMMPRSLPPVFSFQTSVLSQLAFKSLICFELIFCIWCKVVVQFLSLACDYPVFIIPFMEKYFQCFCIICMLYTPSSFVINYHMCGLFSGIFSLFIDLCFCFYACIIRFWLLYFVV